MHRRHRRRLADQWARRHGGDDFQPEFRFGAAAHGHQAVDLGTAFTQRIEIVAEGKGEAIEHGVGQGVAVRLVGNAHHDAAHLRITDGRAFAGEIRQQQCGGWALELCAQRLGELWGWCLQDARQPFEAGGRRQDHAHLVPGVGYGVAEGVHHFAGIGAERVVRDKNDAGCADGEKARAIS